MTTPRKESSDNWRALHGIAFFALAAAVNSFHALHFWPLPLLAPLIAYALFAAAIPVLRATVPIPRCGVFSRMALLATFVIAIGSVAVLIAFDRVMKPDVSSYATFLPVSALGGVIVAGILFSILNPLLEELIFRGILYEAVESQCGRAVAIVLTAALFGVAHMRGYPPGVAGALLAGVYGVCLGWLRASTGGVALPVLAHIVADATIYILLAQTGVFQR